MESQLQSPKEEIKKALSTKNEIGYKQEVRKAIGWAALVVSSRDVGKGEKILGSEDLRDLSMILYIKQLVVFILKYTKKVEPLDYDSREMLAIRWRDLTWLLYKNQFEARTRLF